MPSNSATHRLSARPGLSRITSLIRNPRLPHILRGPSRTARAETLGSEIKTVFFHPPKCGGNSVTHAFSRAYRGSKYASPNALFFLHPLASQRAANTLGIRAKTLREEILSYALKHPGTEVILGHFPYAEGVFANMPEHVNLITLLRHPVDRFLSEYYYNRHKFQREHFATDLDIEEWLWTDQAHGAGNSFTRMFVGDRDLERAISERRASDAEYNRAVERAIANLENFDIVGELGHIKEFFARLNQLCSLKLEPSHKNKSPKGEYPKFDEHAPEVKDRIMSLCEGDLRIYRHFFES